MASRASRRAPSFIVKQRGPAGRKRSQQYAMYSLQYEAWHMGHGGWREMAASYMKVAQTKVHARAAALPELLEHWRLRTSCIMPAPGCDVMHLVTQSQRSPMCFHCCWSKLHVLPCCHPPGSKKMDAPCFVASSHALHTTSNGSSSNTKPAAVQRDKGVSRFHD